MSDARIVPEHVITACKDCPWFWETSAGTLQSCSHRRRATYLRDKRTIPDDCPLERAKEAHDD